MEYQVKVGDVVIYYSYGTPGGEFPSIERAAIVAEVHDETLVTVCVINPSGIFFNKVKYSADFKPGCWGFKT